MNQFLQLITVRACKYSWDQKNDGIFHIRENASGTISETNNLIKNYRIFFIEEVR